MDNNEKELIKSRDECVKLGLLEKQGKNLNGEDVYIKTEKGEQVYKELLEDAKKGKFRI